MGPGAKHSHVLISPYYSSGSGETCASAEEPLPTVTAKARFGMVMPVTHADGSHRARDVDTEPLPTLTTAHRGELAFITAQHGEREGQAPRVHDVGEPAPTIAARDPSEGATSFRSVELHTWTEEEIAVFEAHWPIGSRERLAFALLLFTGQRGSDVHRMTWADIVGDSIRVTQMKTKTKLVVPLHSSLSAILAGTKRAHVALLTTLYGRPFSLKGFGNFISGAIVALACRRSARLTACARRQHVGSPRLVAHQNR